jgi:hypothetical protein
VQSAKARRTTVKSIGNIKSANSSAARPKSAAGTSSIGSTRILRNSNGGRNQTHPETNEDEREERENAEINQPVSESSIIFSFE